MNPGQEVLERHRQAGGFITVEDLKIFYRHDGPAAGTPLVLTHGIPRSSFLYRRMIPILAQNRPVRAWDLYGFGLSEKPLDPRRYSFPEFERFFGKFLDTMGIEKAHLVCHDVGGPFTIGWAVHNPHRVASLTIMNTTVYLAGFHIPGPVLTFIVLPQSTQERLMPDGPYGDFIHRYVQKKALYRAESLEGAEAQAFKELMVRDHGRWCLGRTVKAYRVVLPYLLEVQRLLREFSRPTQILWGKHDPFCTLPIAARFVKNVEGSEIKVIHPASHFLQEDAPEEVSAAILDFVGRVESR